MGEKGPWLLLTPCRAWGRLGEGTGREQKLPATSSPDHQPHKIQWLRLELDYCFKIQTPPLRVKFIGHFNFPAKNFNQNVQIDYRLARMGVLIRRGEEDEPLEHRPRPLLEEGRPGRYQQREGRLAFGQLEGKRQQKARWDKTKDKLSTSVVSNSSPLGKETEYKYNK